MAPLRQSLPAASFSASSAIVAFACLASSALAARSALRASRRSAMSGLECVEPRGQGVEVADGLRLGDRLLDLRHRRGGVVGRQGAGLDPLLEQVDLDHQTVVALAVEVERGRGVAVRPLPDDALAVLGA